MKIIRIRPARDPIVRAEYHGNKYDVPRSSTQRRGINWPLWAVAGLVGLYLIGIFVLIPLMTQGRFG